MTLNDCYVDDVESYPVDLPLVEPLSRGNNRVNLFLDKNMIMMMIMVVKMMMVIFMFEIWLMIIYYNKVMMMMINDDDGDLSQYEPLLCSTASRHL